jgi:hypothetical protein
VERRVSAVKVRGMVLFYLLDLGSLMEDWVLTRKTGAVREKVVLTEALGF